MLTNLALIFLLGLLLGKFFVKLKLPSLVGMIFTGMILSPYAFNLLNPTIINLSTDLRQLALIIILTRAGLSLDIADLRKVGRPAVLMCFLPACFEIIGVILFAPLFLGMSYLDSAIMGAVIAAVSPAVIVPRMIKMMEEGYGKEKCIPQMILAGASVDDIFVIVIFTAFISLATGKGASVIDFVQIPVSIVLGIIIGIVVGFGLVLFFKKFHMRDTIKLIIILCISFLIIELQNQLEGIVPISGLLAIMSMGISIYGRNSVLGSRLSVKYNKIWIAAEILLFVLVGATVDLDYALKAGVSALAVVLIALLFRMSGVFVCLIKTKLNLKEKLFCMIAYTPKATVQAAIGSIPLSIGLDCGQQVLTVAVISILVTAPLGAFGIDNLYKKLLLKK